MKNVEEFPELSGEQILAADDLPIVKVSIPEWKTVVFVRTLSGSERDAWEGQLVRSRAENEHEALDNVRATLVSLVAVDSKGNRKWSLLDAQRLGAKSSKALDRIYTVASSLNGISQKDKDELAKNSVSGPSDDIGSSSPAN